MRNVITFARQDVEQARAGEQAVRHQGMQVRMEVEVFAEGVNGHDDPGQTFGKSERGTHEL